MSLEQLSALAPAVEMKTAKCKTEAEKIYDSHRAQTVELLQLGYLKQYTAKIGKNTLTISVDKSGFPVNLDELATLVGNYGGPLVAHIEREYNQGKRGEDLAKEVAKEVCRLWKVIASRSQECAGSICYSKNVGVKVIEQ